MRETLSLPPELDGELWETTISSPFLSHSHVEVEMNLVLTGEAAYLVDGRRYPLKRNTLIWLFPDQDHVLLDYSRDFAMWVLVVKPEAVADACRTESMEALRGASPPAEFCRNLTEAAAQTLHRQLREVHGIRSSPDAYNAGLIWGLLASWTAFQQAETEQRAMRMHPAVERAVKLICEESDPLSLADMGRLIGLSGSRLSRLFHQQTGVTLAQFRNQQRLERFFRHMETSGGILDAALEAGFGSYPQFFRVFRDRHGCGPAEYLGRARPPKPVKSG